MASSVNILEMKCYNKLNAYMKSNQTYLKHIAEAIERLQGYIGSTTYEQFCNNEMMLAATVRELEIIGEASSNLSKDFHIEHNSIEFRDAVDMRNFLIHEYFGVNPKIVWDTCKNDITKLKAFIDKLLES